MSFDINVHIKKDELILEVEVMGTWVEAFKPL